MDIDLFSVFSGKKPSIDVSSIPIITVSSSSSGNGEKNQSAEISTSSLHENNRIAHIVETKKRKHDVTISEAGEIVDDAKRRQLDSDSKAVEPSDTSVSVIQQDISDNNTIGTSNDVVKFDRPPAKTYPFSLDTFQREAIGHIERDESVLVAAHTSAGKTAVAEYAIAKSLRDKQRVIYTSPIKALSNQKYRDLQEEFGDVGLMTGDMTINPHATCLIMTTEILRSMLYRGSEVIREVAWVIYDEVHYMRDKERGVVWEESIILLPHKVRFVFLSATIPNARQFVDWVSKIHRQPCHVVYTEYRPVPLQHFVFPAGSEGLYLVVDEKGKFRDDNFQKAMALLQQGNQEGDDGNNKGKRMNSKSQASKNLNSDLFKIVKLIMDRELDPCIVFSFSKKDCETYALQMAKLDFNNTDEKELVEKVFLNAMEALSDDDQNLPQVSTILPLLKRGIGIHHGGLLPILKEVIEILFQEGLIKCLFATETFSIGINMPAKTVVFTNARKFDGKDFRWISSGEYIQMSGRAGRRGKDDKGIVIQMLDEKMEPDVAKDMVYGASDPLHSSYHVSYNMLLNMLRVEDADPENILRASFHQFEQEQGAPQLLSKADEIFREASNIVFDDERLVVEYYSTLQFMRSLHRDMNVIAMQPIYVLPMLQAGRVIEIVMNNRLSQTSLFQDILSYGVVLSVSKGDKKKSSEYSIDVLVDMQEFSSGTSATTTPTTGNLIPITFEEIRAVSSIRLALPKDNLNSIDSQKKLLKTLQEARRRFIELPMLDPSVDFGVASQGYSDLKVKLKEASDKLSSSSIHSDEKREEILNKYHIKFKLLEEAKALRTEATQSQALAMKDTMRKMKRVLKKLQYISQDGVLGPKGRFACELTTGDELVLTDMIFDGTFNDLTAEQTVAVLSCFVHKEGSKDKAKYRAEFNTAIRQLQTTARNVCRVCNEVKLLMDEEEYVESFNTQLLEVTYAWASGAKFVEICKLTEIFEGSIIRSIRRLEELLRQLASASTAIGNHELRQKFDEGADKIRRGVVFAASLYI